MTDSFSSHQVIALTEITARQLQWWDERGVVTPAREGHRRLYSLQNLTEIAVICELRRKGFSLQGVRKVMRFLDREFGKRLAEIVDRDSDFHLLTDGKNLYLETSAQQIVDILKHSDQPILGVCLSDTVRQVRAEIDAKKLAAREANPKTVRSNKSERRKASTSVTSSVTRKRARKVS